MTPRAWVAGSTVTKSVMSVADCLARNSTTVAALSSLLPTGCALALPTNPSAAWVSCAPHPCHLVHARVALLGFTRMNEEPHDRGRGGHRTQSLASGVCVDSGLVSG